MDLDSFSQLARSQGPVFWVATAAIALGATLLLAALAQLLRRGLAERIGRAAGVRVIETPEVPTSDLAARKAAAETYEPSAPPAAAPAPRSAPTAFEDAATAAPAAGESLALLLRRLQSAGDRLEEIAGELVGENVAGDESGLKDELQDVEYVFRASGP